MEIIESADPDLLASGRMARVPGPPLGVDNGDRRHCLSPTRWQLRLAWRTRLALVLAPSWLKVATDGWLNAAEAARYLGLSQRAIYERINAGKLEAMHWPVRIKPSPLKACILRWATYRHDNSVRARRA